MKRFLKAFIPLALAALCLAGCSNIPEEPATTAVEKLTYVNEVGETAPVAENIGDYPGITQPPKNVATRHEVELAVSSYYVYGNTVAEYKSIAFENIDTPQDVVYGSFNCVLTGKGKEGEMKIAYNAYDGNGKLIKKDACMTRSTKNVNENEEISFTFGVPLGTAKIEFTDYK